LPVTKNLAKPHRERRPRARRAVDARGDERVSACAAQLVDRARLLGGQFRHRGRDDVAQPAPAGRRGRKCPRGPLVVHEASSPVDGIDDDRPRRVAPDQPRLVESFGDELDIGPVALEPVDQRVVGNLVDRVGRVRHGRTDDRGRIDGVAPTDDDVAQMVAERTQARACNLRRAP
jgi:hypothetical protein